ncbi:GDSL-type esterase/lipase family protein, partial [Chitinophaga sp.]|uniref:GDSL-type esterase/lipase family protein n=1 Tax=Chitinophaga sp. TaxID=1869181 RepID=UPI002D1D7640
MKVNSVKQVWLIVLLWLCNSPVFSRQQPLKVACIGNSVTYGYGLPNREMNSYPARLQQLLGAGYQVKNFGVSGSTLLKNGHRPYDTTAAFAEMLRFAPDIAIIHLGLNDTDPRDWPDHRDEFIPDYHALIDTIRRVNPEVKVFICRLTPVFHEHPRFKSGTRNWYWQIQEAIEQVAKAAHVGLVDLHAPLYAHPELFADALHPDTTGAAIIAQTVYSRITGSYGGLQLATPFSAHMVLQRRQPLKFYGMADEGEEVTVELLGQRKRSYAGIALRKAATITMQRERLHAEYTGIQRKRIHADAQGHWEISFPAMEAGGPYQVRVSTGRKVVVLEDVMIGEVWICSGQSNMAFPLKDALQETVLHRGSGGNNPLRDVSQGAPFSSNVADRRCGNNPSIRLLHMKPLAPTDNVVWDTATLRKVN